MTLPRMGSDSSSILGGGLERNALAEEQEDKDSKGTIIKPCTCKSVFQDRTYGRSMRVWNTGTGTKRTCTVCGTKK